VRKNIRSFVLFAVATLFTVTAIQASVVIDFESLETVNNTVNFIGDIVVNVVPEPDAWLLVGTGIGIAILFRKLK